MWGPDKGPPQSLETTEFSKLVILFWRMPESISALTRTSMPISLLHLHPYLLRISWSMATKARALQTCNGNSTFFQNTNRGRGGTTLSYNSSVLGAHTQAELVSLSSWGLSPALQRVPWPELSLFFPLHFSCRQKKKKKDLGPGFLCQVLYKYLILLFSMCEYIKRCLRKTCLKAICFLFKRVFWI